MQKSIGDLLPEWSPDTPVTADNLKLMVEAIRTALREVDLRLPTKGGTVEGNLNVTESLTRAGNAVYDTGNKPTATDVGAVPQKKITLDLLHLSNEVYYPILFDGATNKFEGAMQYELVRFASQDGDQYPNLYAKIIFRGTEWQVNGTYFHMIYSTTFGEETKLIGKVTVPYEGNRFVVYLRGGYSYYLTAYGLGLNLFEARIVETQITIGNLLFQPFHVSGATPLEYGFFEVVNQNEFEITGTKYMRLKDTYLTDDGERVYSPNNVPDKMKISFLNEANFANGFAMDNGDLYVNYRDAVKPIKKYLMCNGKMTGELANLSAKAIYEGDKRVYSPNNKPTAADIGALYEREVDITPTGWFYHFGNLLIQWGHFEFNSDGSVTRNIVLPKAYGHTSYSVSINHYDGQVINDYINANKVVELSEGSFSIKKAYKESSEKILWITVGKTV